MGTKVESQLHSTGLHFDAPLATQSDHSQQLKGSTFAPVIESQLYNRAETIKTSHSSERNSYSLAHVNLTFVFIVEVQVIVVPVALGEWRAVERQGEKEERWWVIFACYSPVCSGEVGPHRLPGLHSCTAQSPLCQCDRLPPVITLRMETWDFLYPIPDPRYQRLTIQHGFVDFYNSAVKALSVSQICIMQGPKKVFETCRPPSMWHLQTNDAKPFYFISHFAFMWLSRYFWSVWKYFRPQNRYKQQDITSCSMVFVLCHHRNKLQFNIYLNKL